MESYFIPYIFLGSAKFYNVLIKKQECSESIYAVYLFQYFVKRTIFSAFFFQFLIQRIFLPSKTSISGVDVFLFSGGFYYSPF